MERKINLWIKSQLKDKNKKPIVLTGPTMVGKTYEAITIGKTEFKYYIYVSLEYNKIIINLLNKEMNIDRLFLTLKTLYNIEGTEEDTLIIFDDINYYDKMINVLVRFSDTKKYNVIALGNSVIIPKNNTSYVEKIIFKKMNVLDFEDYLLLNDETKLIESIKYSYGKTRANPYHDKITKYFLEYLVTGGYPSCINEYLTTKDYNKVLFKQHEIIKNINNFVYKNFDGNYEKINNIIKSTPEQLFKINKKFQYGVIKKGARMSEYITPIEYLKKNDFVIKCNRVNIINRTLSYSSDNSSFKLFLNDSGLLSSMYGMDYSNILDSKWSKHLSAVVDNYVAVTLHSKGYMPYYYESDGKASVPFVIQTIKGKIIPIDIGRKKKAKNITEFNKNNNNEYSINLTFNNFSKNLSIKNIPLYSLFCIEKDNN